MEVHLEQGPVLETSNKALGVVSAIAGQTRLVVSVIGTQVLKLKIDTQCFVTRLITCANHDNTVTR